MARAGGLIQDPSDLDGGGLGGWQGCTPDPRPRPAAPALGLPPASSPQVASEQGLLRTQSSRGHPRVRRSTSGWPRALGHLAPPPGLVVLTLLQLP